MAKYVFVVMTNAAPGQEAEFNRWYDEEHLGDVLKLPGMVSAQRFQVAAEEAANPQASLKFLTLYEIETDDLSRTQAALAAAAGTPAMPISPALAREGVYTVYFKATGEKVFAR
jgi:hypothetical protein